LLIGCGFNIASAMITYFSIRFDLFFTLWAFNLF
jgi:hypothetical protein